MEVKTNTVEVIQDKDGSWRIETDVPLIPTEVVNDLLKQLGKLQKESLPVIKDVKELIRHNKLLQIGNYFWFSVAFLLFLMLIWR
jgi:hypothetical protein